jgi:hypothetical protein
VCVCVVCSHDLVNRGNFHDSVYSGLVIMCVYACVCANICVASQSPLFNKVSFLSDSTACISYLMWNRVPCSHVSMWYCASSIYCSGLGDCEETSGGMACGVRMAV